MDPLESYTLNHGKMIIGADSKHSIDMILQVFLGLSRAYYGVVVSSGIWDRGDASERSFRAQIKLLNRIACIEDFQHTALIGHIIT